MEDKEFVKEVATLYRKARTSIYPDELIRRGRNHTVASQVEDLFAAFVLRNLPEIGKLDGRVFIDQPITFSKEGRRKSLYPDVAIGLQNRLTQLWDLKMDLGWNRRGFLEFCAGKSALVKEIRGCEAKLFDGTTSKSYIFDERVTYNVAVISKLNISASMLGPQLDKVGILENIGVYFLTERAHPNDPSHKTIELFMEAVRLNEIDFKKLRERLKEAVS